MEAGPQLNAEPSQPEDREKQNLPPKSYVDAVQEDHPETSDKPANGSKGGSQSGGREKVDETHPNLHVNGASDESGPRATVLRILPTNGESKSDGTSNGNGQAIGDGTSSSEVNGNEEPGSGEQVSGSPAAENNKAERPAIERQESRHEYEAAVRIILRNARFNQLQSNLLSEQFSNLPFRVLMNLPNQPHATSIEKLLRDPQATRRYQLCPRMMMMRSSRLSKTRLRLGNS